MNQANGDRRVARNAAIVASAFVLWAALVLLFAAPLALTGRISWQEAISFGASFWALWLLFLPAVASLSFRLPIQRKNLIRNVGLHLVACLLIVGATKIGFRAVEGIFPRPQPSENSPAPGGSPDAKPGRPGPPGAFGVFLGFRAALDVLVYWSLVGACQAITNFQRSQERERRAVELEASLTNAKLQALRMQINPHFLFNTLNSISALIYTDPRAADEMLGDLSELLRRSLHSMEEQEIPLAQELEFIGAYLRIEQKRFGERLRLEQVVPDELTRALVPALILQPLVENAIRHGLEPRRGPGLISIEAKRENNRLHLIVRDDGRGLPAQDNNDSAPDGMGRMGALGGIGLSNTKARLQGLYGANQSFSLKNAAPHGCQADIYLPFHLEPMLLPGVSNEARKSNER